MLGRRWWDWLTVAYDAANPTIQFGSEEGRVGDTDYVGVHGEIDAVMLSSDGGIIWR